MRIVCAVALWSLLGCALAAAEPGAAQPKDVAQPDKAAKPEGAASSGGAEASASDSVASEDYVTERVRGKVVWLDEALKRLHGITSEPDAEKTQVVLETADGRLWPLAPDTRGRSFLVDERLRDIEVDLLVRRYKSAPFLQVIRVMRPTEDGLVDVDYWCDICAIPMYIQKPCECCQGESRLRERPVEEVFDPAAK